MAKLSLPDHTRPYLILLANASPPQIDALCNVLEAAPLQQAPDELARALKAKNSGWSDDDVDGVLRSILGLAAFKAQASMDSEEFSMQVLEALRRRPYNSAAETALGVEKEGALKQVLSRLFGIPNLLLASKVVGVLTDNQRSFISARILSDMRPVFADDILSGPKAAVIVHSMKIEYAESNEIREFFVALDNSDLRAIVGVANRALEKETAMRKLLEQTKIPFFENK